MRFRALTAACTAIGLLVVPGCVTAEGYQPGGHGGMAMMQHGPDGMPMAHGPDGHMHGGKDCTCPMMKHGEQATAPAVSPETPPPAHKTPAHEE